MPMDSAQGASTLNEALLHGCWELVAWTRSNAAGTLSYPMGEAARGRIIYDRSGLMMAFLMAPEHLNAAPGGPEHPFLAYSGRYELKGDVVEHAVDAASDPRFVGLILRRRVVPEGQQVVLETLASAGQAEREGKHRLIWRRPA